jgi:hypothetical protein
MRAKVTKPTPFGAGNDRARRVRGDLGLRTGGVLIETSNRLLLSTF